MTDEFHHDRDRWTDRLLDAPERPLAYDGQTGAAFDAWRSAFRAELGEVLGLPAIRANGVPDPAPRRHGTTRADGHERQSWSVRTERGFRVPLSVLLPDDESAPHPTVLALHGHAEAGRRLAVGEVTVDGDRERIADERRDIARQAVERGYAAVAPDMRAFGDLAGPDPPDGGRRCTRAQKTAQLVGRSLVGGRVWDALRLIGFVEGRPALDADRLAAVGHSGGGTVALYAAALDDRLSPVVPCASVCPFADSLVPIDHCVCNYVPGIARLGEVWDVAAAVAPRPLLVAAGEDDPIFPVAGTRRAFDRIRDAYRGAGAPEACELYVGAGGHRFHEAGVWPFVRGHL